MTSQRTLNARTIRLNISDAGPRFGSTKLGTASARGALTLLAVLSGLLPIAARPAQAQTQTVLYNFTGGSDGGGPLSSLTSHGGNFYGTTQFGGAAGSGTVFELLPNGSGGWNETVLYNFCSEGGSGEVCTSGADPNGPVVFDSVGNLYGTTPEGGNSNCDDDPGCGVGFELSPAGAGWTETVLYSFCSQGGPGTCPGGAYPGGLGRPGSLVMDPAGNLYSTNASGVFELSPSAGGWTEKVIYYVGGFGGLTMDAAGNIFGVGVSDYTGQRIVFELSPNGKGGWNSTVIYTFTTSSPNSDIWSSPALDQAGNLYGTETGWYNVYRGPAEFSGTVYKLSPGETGWTKTVIYNFLPDDSELEGNAPSGGLVLDSVGNIYGTTIQGGTTGQGTVFELVPPVGAGSYKEKVLWNFDGADGSGPNGGLILDSAGNLYGTTGQGGSSGNGVVFEVSSATAVVKPTALTFGPQRLQTTSPAKRISLFNDGPLPITVTSVNLQGEFAVSANNCQNGVKPNTHCDIYVTFTPTGTGTSPRAGTITFVDTASNSPQSARLSGTVGVSETSVTTSGSPSFVGQPVTFTAHVTSAQGTIPDGGLVTFYDGTTTLGSVALASETAVYTTSSLSRGNHEISATYAGDAAFDPSRGSKDQVVDKDPTTTALTSSLNPSIYGQKVTWTATVKTSGSTIPTGIVRFNWSSYSIGTATLNSSGVATLTLSDLSADAYPLFAVYTGDTNNGTSTSPILNQVITQTTSAAAITASPNPSTQGQSVTFTARITSPTATPAGPVTFTAGKTVLGSVELSDGKAKFTTSTLAVGSTKVTVTYPSDADISGSSASVTQVVQQ
jgi:uncharacterized repeat protein (TIGR03803 family)